MASLSTKGSFLKLGSLEKTVVLMELYKQVAPKKLKSANGLPLKVRNKVSRNKETAKITVGGLQPNRPINCSSLGIKPNIFLYLRFTDVINIARFG